MRLDFGRFLFATDVFVGVDLRQFGGRLVVGDQFGNRIGIAAEARVSADGRSAPRAGPDAWVPAAAAWARLPLSSDFGSMSEISKAIESESALPERALLQVRRCGAAGARRRSRGPGRRWPVSRRRRGPCGNRGSGRGGRRAQAWRPAPRGAARRARRDARPRRRGGWSRAAAAGVGGRRGDGGLGGGGLATRSGAAGRRGGTARRRGLRAGGGRRRKARRRMRFVVVGRDELGRALVIEELGIGDDHRDAEQVVERRARRQECRGAAVADHLEMEGAVGGFVAAPRSRR